MIKTTGIFNNMEYLKKGYLTGTYTKYIIDQASNFGADLTIGKGFILHPVEPPPGAQDGHAAIGISWGNLGKSHGVEFPYGWKEGCSFGTLTLSLFVTLCHSLSYELELNFEPTQSGPHPCHIMSLHFNTGSLAHKIKGWTPQDHMSVQEQSGTIAPCHQCDEFLQAFQRIWDCPNSQQGAHLPMAALSLLQRTKEMPPASSSLCFLLRIGINLGWTRRG